MTKTKRPLAGWTRAFPDQHRKLRPLRTTAGGRRVNFRPVSKRRFLRRRSPERAKQDRIYNARVKVWLTEPGNHWCRVLPKLKATQCHHLHGRGWRGELLMVEELWIPVSAEGHNYIHQHPDWARMRGLLAPKGEWNRRPK